MNEGQRRKVEVPSAPFILMSANTPAKFGVCILHSCDFIALTKSIPNQQINTARHLKHFAMMTHADTAGYNQWILASFAILKWKSLHCCVYQRPLASVNMAILTTGYWSLRFFTHVGFCNWQDKIIRWRKSIPILTGGRTNQSSYDWPEGWRPFSSHVVSILKVVSWSHSSFQRNCSSRVRSQVFSMWKRTSACVSSASFKQITSNKADDWCEMQIKMRNWL